ncbi:hypothetical protein FB451DRAFT_1498447 [Mycena latifolia]|nr:hypothetical protein FB451DRAFT_1498447 [Mycena latifolia]
MESSSLPVFPPELERQIFEIQALAQPGSILQLMLEPLLYRTFITGRSVYAMFGYRYFTCATLSSAIKARPATLFRAHVRNLFLMHDAADDLQPILSVCTSVENLWIANIKDDDVLLLASFPLKRLSSYFDPFLRNFPPAHPIFSQITHLELSDIPADTTVWLSRISLIPHLTHLAFHDPGFLPICPPLLEKCTSLSVLICFCPYEVELYDGVALLERDVRFVAMSWGHAILDWQMGIHTGLDYWSEAKAYIAKRRAGEIMGPQFWLVEDDD